MEALMDAALVEECAAVEAEHWWFQGRRRIMQDALARRLDERVHRCLRILDLGCGTGEMLEMLTGFGDVTGMDSSPDAVAWCRQRLGSGAAVLLGSIPESLPTEGGFDLVTAFDVIEHLDDDTGALSRCHELLSAEGLFVCTVPAYMALWSDHDERNHHRRRYSRSLLCRRLSDAGFEVERTSYFNTWLLPLVAAARLVKRHRRPRPSTADPARIGESDLAMPPRWLNRLLSELFASERFLIRAVSLPAGVSIMAICRKGKAA